MRGSTRQASADSSKPNTAIATNGMCQLDQAAMNKLVGTPTTVAREKADKITDMARPRRSNGINSATMVCTRAESTPPNTPVAMRAATRLA